VTPTRTDRERFAQGVREIAAVRWGAEGIGKDGVMALRQAPVCQVPKCHRAATAFVVRGEVFVGPPTRSSQAGVCAPHMAEVIEVGRRSQVLASLASAYPSVR